MSFSCYLFFLRQRMWVSCLKLQQPFVTLRVRSSNGDTSALNQFWQLPPLDLSQKQTNSQVSEPLQVGLSPAVRQKSLLIQYPLHICLAGCLLLVVFYKLFTYYRDLPLSELHFLKLFLVFSTICAKQESIYFFLYKQHLLFNLL